VLLCSAASIVHGEPGDGHSGCAEDDQADNHHVPPRGAAPDPIAGVRNVVSGLALC
jgi:hypothetical protein